MTGQIAVIEFQTVARRASMTRPNNATAYDPGDAVSAAGGLALEFDRAVQPKGNRRSAQLTTATIRTNTGGGGTHPSLELWLFREPLTNQQTDNAPFAPTWADLANFVALVEWPDTAWRVAFEGDEIDTEGSSVSVAAGIGQVVVAGPDGRLYGHLVVRSAYTPIELQQFSIELVLTQD